MRTITRLAALVLALVIVILPRATRADAVAADAGPGTPATSVQAARRAIAEGVLALADTRPDRAAARALFESALASADPRVVAEAHFRLGALDDDEGAYARSFEEHRACLALSPGGRVGRNAKMRLDWLSARSEGGFAPLSRLQAVRLDPAFAHDAEAIAAFAREADSFPPGIVRSEARMTAAEDWMALRRLDEALPLLVLVRDDPRSLGTTVGLAEERLVTAWLDEGRLDDAAKEVDARTTLVGPAITVKVRHLVRARTWRRAAVADLAIVTAMAVVAVALARRRRGPCVLVEAARAIVAFRSALLVAAAYALLAAVLVLLRPPSARVAACIVVAGCAIPVAMIGVGALSVGPASAVRRLVTIASCASAMAAASYLALDAFVPGFLAGIGV